MPSPHSLAPQKARGSATFYGSGRDAAQATAREQKSHSRKARGPRTTKSGGREVLSLKLLRAYGRSLEVMVQPVDSWAFIESAVVRPMRLPVIARFTLPRTLTVL